jgi:hypothetical protein
MGRSRALASALLFFSFVLVSVVQSWPLPRSLGTSLTGPVGGDTGVYVWNIWVFRHEIEQGHSPMSTRTIFAPGEAANLSLHNYTVAADLIAWPLQSFLGVVAAFNVIYLLNVTLAGLGCYLLARRIWRSEPIPKMVAWAAGLTFACSPFLVARSTAHFSLVAAAPLPFFVLCFERTWETGRIRDAVSTGACVAWAMYSDPYYAVYCVLLGIAITFGHMARIETTRKTAVRSLRTRVLDIAIAGAALLVAVVGMLSTDSIAIGRTTISVKSLYTPVLLLVVLVVCRLWLTFRPRVVPVGGLPRNPATAAAAAVGTATILLAPILVALASRIASAGFDSAPVLWRSSAPGVDLVSFFLPNPNHALAPRGLADWLSHEPGRYEENVVSIPWTAMVVIAAARLATGRWASRLWLGVVIAAASLTLGPFVRIAGVETYVPTPWALLRYVPIIGEARMPPRFGVIVILGVAVLFAGALELLCRRYPNRRRTLIAGVLLLATFELMPVPRQIYPATFPSIYTTIRNDPRDVTVLELPAGMLDGLSAIGKYSAISQFFQTAHGKPIVGGYLSRVPDAEKQYLVSRPLLAALVEGSAGRTMVPEDRVRALADASGFVRDASLGYVVIDDARTSKDLREFAIDALKLREVGREGGLGLFVPELGPSAGD